MNATGGEKNLSRIPIWTSHKENILPQVVIRLMPVTWDFAEE